MDIISKINFLLNEKVNKWSGKVKTKWHPKEGIFTKSASEIASYLASNSDDLKQAMSRLDFYINRAGENISDKQKPELEKAKDLLRKKFGEEK